MAKRIVIDLNEDPPFLPEQLEDFVKQITFLTDNYLDIHEYTMKVENE